MDYEDLRDDLERMGNLLEESRMTVRKYGVRLNRASPVESNNLDVLLEGLREVEDGNIPSEYPELEATVYFFGRDAEPPYDRIVYRPGVVEGELQPTIFPRKSMADSEMEKHLQEVNEVVDEF